MSGCAMACRVLDALIQMIGHCHEPSRRHMLRDQPRRTEEPSVPFVGRKRRTGSGIMLQSLLLRLPRLQHTEGESLSAEDIALPTATEGREPGLASMGTIWTWRRWTSSLPTLLPSLRGWMVDAQQYHVPRGVCKKSIIPAAHGVHSDQSLSSLEDVWHTQGAGI